MVPDTVPGEQVELYFEGLDTYTTIWLNGRLVGRHTNMSVPCRFNMTNYVRGGEENELVIMFESTISALEGKDTKLM